MEDEATKNYFCRRDDDTDDKVIILKLFMPFLIVFAVMAVFVVSPGLLCYVLLLSIYPGSFFIPLMLTISTAKHRRKDFYSSKVYWLIGCVLGTAITAFMNWQLAGTGTGITDVARAVNHPIYTIQKCNREYKQTCNTDTGYYVYK